MVVAGLCSTWVAVWAGGSTVDSIYQPAVLADRQERYAKWFAGILEHVITPHLSDVERGMLARVRLEFPEKRAGDEPFGFYSRGKTVYLSVASLKFFNDLILAYAWLGRHGYNVDTVNDYLRMLHRWSMPGPPPEPLRALGIPDNAREDAGTDRLATLLTRNIYTFILLHELGHLYHKDPPSNRLPAIGQARETAADRFALEVAGRLGTVSTGMAQFFGWSWTYMPNRADYAHDAAYEAAIQTQSHPLSTQRLTEVADDIERNAGNYAVDSASETLAAFRALAAELRKLAALQSEPDIQRLAARRAKMLEARDLAPRRPQEILGRPIDSRAGNGPFEGKLAGTVAGRQGWSHVEVFLENHSGWVRGTLGMGPEIVRLEGRVEDDTLFLTWQSADASGHGVLRRHGDTYEGTVPLWPTQDGSVWALCAGEPAALPLVTPSLAQQDRFVGDWQSSYTTNVPLGTMIVTRTHSFQPDGTFSILEENNMGAKARITGTYTFPAQATIKFYYKDWEPPNRRLPACAHYQYQFQSPTTVVLTSGQHPPMTLSKRP
jgi:hypothetical protein